jgi:hypothetical protein
MRLLFIFILVLLLAACAPAVESPPPVRLDVYASPAAEPWLSEAFACAAGQGIILGVASAPEEADLFLRIGEPAALLTPAFQIDTEEILVVTHRESPVQNLNADEALDLFARSLDPSVQVWVYSTGDDVQQAFDGLLMHGEPVTSLARLATSPQEMSDVLNAEADSVVILPRHWKVGMVREVFSAGTVPVLAIVRSEPEEALRLLIACLQK